MGTNNYELLEYKIDTLEKTQDKVVYIVETIDKKQSEQITAFEVLKTRVGMYVAAIGFTVSVLVSISTNYISSKPSYTEAEKQDYYNKRIQSDPAVARLRARIAELEKDRVATATKLDLLISDKVIP